MTATELARVTEAIDADQRQTDVSNWPLSRERTRAYMALASACAMQQAAFDACGLAMPGAPYRAAWGAWVEAGDGVRAALAALAPEQKASDA